MEDKLSIGRILSPNTERIYENKKIGAYAIILLIVALWWLSQPSIAISPIIDLPSEYSFITENTLVGQGKAMIWGSESEVWQAIWSANHQYPEISMDLLYDLAICESGLRIDAKGDNGKAYGLFQFWKSTFNLFCEGNYKSASDQAICAAKMFSEGKQNHWRRCWTVLANIQY